MLNLACRKPEEPERDRVEANVGCPQKTDNAFQKKSKTGSATPSLEPRPFVLTGLERVIQAA